MEVRKKERIEKMMKNGIKKGKVKKERRNESKIVRRKKIEENVMEEGQMRIEDMKESFGIRMMKENRDVDEMVRRGMLRKQRGIVQDEKKRIIEERDIYRVKSKQEEKKMIEEEEMKFVEKGKEILLED